MAKRKKLIITREGYLVLAAVGVLLIALIIIAFATKGFGACSKEKEAVSNTPSASEYHPAPTFTPKATSEEIEYVLTDTPAPETPDVNATSSPSPSPVLEADPDALTEPTAEMIAGAAEGKLTGGGVNMRQGPSVNTPIVASGLKKGTKLTVYGEFGTDPDSFYFVQVQVKDTKKYGYIAKKFIKLLSALRTPVKNDDQPEGTVAGTVNIANLILRDGPGITNNKIGEYNQGQRVYIFYEEGGYYYVQIAGSDLKGYLSAQFITAEGPVPKKDS